jgi:hypothetical protein
MVTRAALIAVFFACCTPAYAADAVFYDGVFDLGKGPVGRWEKAKLRQWLWAHWHPRTARTAILKWVTMEGDSGTTAYTIAKGRDGAWYLSIHLQGSERPMSEGDTAKWRDEWTIAYPVQRVQEPYHWDWPGKLIADSSRLSARRFVLELKDKEGKILTHI